MTLSPAPSSLGLASPALGPWFSTDVTLQAPSANGSVSVAIPAGTNWLPPAAGFLSLVVATDPRPGALARLRDVEGDYAFTDGRLVALFRLLPEVEVRLKALLSGIERVDGGTGTSTVPTRVGVRWFALELPEASPTLADLDGRLAPPFPSGLSASDKAEHVGLSVGSSSALGNVRRAMTDLKRPGDVAADDATMLRFPAGATVNLWAFDARGRCVDPGAVAAWWRRLTQLWSNLFASGIATADRRTASTADNLAVHLVNAHEGFLDVPFDTRLTATNLTGTGSLRSKTASSGAVQIAFAAAPTPDDAPEPRAAVLPNGTYAATVSLWATAPTGPLTRDFIRVAAVGLEEHLVGQPRIAPAGASADVEKRATDQDRVSTGVRVGRTSTTVFVETADAASAEITGVVAAGSAPARVVTSVLERDWGPIVPPALPNLPSSETLPGTLPAPTVRALTGGGATGNPAIGQQVLFEMALPVALANAWVRVWTLGFNATEGRHIRLDGGGGRVRVDGNVSCVIRLPDGPVPSPAAMAVDVSVVMANAERFYPDVRFARPAPIGGAAVAPGAVTSDVVVCESGQVIPSGSPLTGAVIPGSSVVALSTPPALVDRTALAATAFPTNAIARVLAAGDKVELTQPAYIALPPGDSAAVIAATGATVNRQGRTGITRGIAAGVPIPTMERLEVAAATVDGTSARAALGAAPALGRVHEILPHHLGHPGAPATAELHATGVRLEGEAAVALAEAVRDRVERTTLDLATAAATPFATPPAIAAPGPLAAVLRTVAAGVEAELGVAQAVEGSQPFTFGDTLDDVRTWLSNEGITIPAAVGAAADSIVRALDRRLLAASRGLREAATSLAAAFARAEDLVYIETPALDDLAVADGTDDELHLWQVLRDQMDARRGLRVVICVPLKLFPGVPQPLQRVRDAVLGGAIRTLTAGDAESPGVPPRSDRVAVFCPRTGPGRTLRMSSTTVVVDDAYALTGTTHLWRRGLSFDSSLAAAVFDERVTEGRPTEVLRFRRALLAGRLGIAANLVPDDPEEIVTAIKTLVDRGGSAKISTDSIPTETATAVDQGMWDPDGSPTTGLDPVAWITNLVAASRDQLAAEVPS